MGNVWLEKYRPGTLDEIVGNTEALERLSVIAQDGNMPHILIVGPPGTGKTTSVLALAKALLGSSFKKGVIELNASDDRGIDVVRDRLKGFAREKLDLPEGSHKIIILDEVDSMTESAQQALRRLMEVYSSSTRFALACNQSTKIIDAIQSRCAIIRFGKLKDHEILHRLKHICHEEKVTFEEDGLKTLLLTAEGDMRNAINNLQSTVNGFGVVTHENVIKISDIPPPETITAIINHCLASDFSSATSLSNSLFQEGYTPLDLVPIMKTLLRRLTIVEVVALEYLKAISRCHFALVDGICSKLQFDALLANLCEITLRLSKP